MGKLIRDKVPQLVREAGGSIETRTLDEPEFDAALRNKLIEEAHEVADAPRDVLLEELSDVLSVLEELGALHGHSLAAVTDAASAKRRTAGGFDQRLFSQRFTP